MKTLYCLMLLLFSASSLAGQGNPAAPMMDPAKMQEMMRIMQNCYQDIDQQELNRLQQRAEALENKVKALCRQGKRDQAMQQATTFAKEIRESKSLTKMRECGNKMKGLMPMPDNSKLDYYSEKDFKKKHVCGN